MPELSGVGRCTCVWTIILKAITIAGKLAAIACAVVTNWPWPQLKSLKYNFVVVIKLQL